MELSPDDRRRLSAAIHAAEARTSGEIVCVLARSSADGTAWPIFVAAVVSLVLPWILVELTRLTVQQILALQIVIFLVLGALLCLPRLRIALLPRATRQAIAHRAATEQFARRGVARTKDRTGILIFVSLAEHYARIVADEGIAARVPQAEWQGAVDALIAHVRDGRIADGFVAAIESCGNVLAMHFPRAEADRDELPDRVHLI